MRDDPRAPDTEFGTQSPHYDRDIPSIGSNDIAPGHHRFNDGNAISFMVGRHDEDVSRSI